jgi:outer membrane protein
MRNKLMLALVAVFACFAAQAQTGMKIGYAEVDYILSQLPETKVVEADLQAHNTQLQNQLQSKYQEYQEKGATYQQGAASMIEAVRKEKEQELTDLGSRLQQFERDAQASLQKKQNDLMAPLFKKVGDTINAVAAEGGYDYIISSGVGGVDIVLFAKDEHDISDDVLKKLGVTPTAN